MPAKSQAQFRFLQAMEHDPVKARANKLTKTGVDEFLSKTTDYKDLPAKVKSKKNETNK